MGVFCGGAWLERICPGASINIEQIVCVHPATAAATAARNGATPGGFHGGESPGADKDRPGAAQDPRIGPGSALEICGFRTHTFKQIVCVHPAAADAASDGDTAGGPPQETPGGRSAGTRMRDPRGGAGRGSLGIPP